MFLAPALTDIGARRLFAHGVKLQFMNDIAGSLKLAADWRFHADPVGFSEFLIFWFQKVMYICHKKA
jgi:hypothetical protein